MHEDARDARFIIWSDQYDGNTIDSNQGQGYLLNEARLKAATVASYYKNSKIYLLRMEYVYIPPSMGEWKKVG